MPKHQRHLGDTLCYSDVAVNVASTITIEPASSTRRSSTSALTIGTTRCFEPVGLPLLLVHALRERDQPAGRADRQVTVRDDSVGQTVSRRSFARRRGPAAGRRRSAVHRRPGFRRAAACVLERLGGDGGVAHPAVSEPCLETRHVAPELLPVPPTAAALQLDSRCRPAARGSRSRRARRQGSRRRRDRAIRRRRPAHFISIRKLSIAVRPPSRSAAGTTLAARLEWSGAFNPTSCTIIVGRGFF